MNQKIREAKKMYGNEALTFDLLAIGDKFTLHPSVAYGEHILKAFTRTKISETESCCLALGYRTMTSSQKVYPIKEKPTNG